MATQAQQLQAKRRELVEQVEARIEKLKADSPTRDCGIVCEALLYLLEEFPTQLERIAAVDVVKTMIGDQP